MLRSLAAHFGIVRATPEACAALLDANQCVLVYPGGAREAVQGGTRAYQLSWWDRLGFARMAVTHRCTIVPVAATGIDASVRVLADAQTYLRGPLGPWIDRLGVRHGLLPPALIPVRRPRVHFHIAEPIAVDPLLLHDIDKATHALRSRVAQAIEAQLARALAIPGNEGGS